MFEGTSLDEAFAAPMDMSAMSQDYSKPQSSSSGSGTPRYNPSIDMEEFTIQQPSEYPPTLASAAAMKGEIQDLNNYRSSVPMSMDTPKQQPPPKPRQQLAAQPPRPQVQYKYQQPEMMMVAEKPVQAVTVQPVASIPVANTPVWEPSLLDRMMDRRTEVARLIVVGLVIVFALAVDKLITYYLQEYLSRNVVTDVKELLLRAMYPIGVILLLWLLKSM